MTTVLLFERKLWNGKCGRTTLNGGHQRRNGNAEV